MHISKGVGLAQNRLAIIDLSTGDQPIHEPGGAALIANAEIYNYIELRRELTDVRFTSQSDCEPPLHLYRKHGVDFARKLRGMYAIAIYDAAKDRLVLSRDPFGIKPLYIAKPPSSLPLLPSRRPCWKPVSRHASVNATQRNELLQLQYMRQTDHLQFHSTGHAGRDCRRARRPYRRPSAP